MQRRDPSRSASPRFGMTRPCLGTASPKKIAHPCNLSETRVVRYFRKQLQKIKKKHFMHGELLIPILVPLGLFALIFGIVYMNKKENLAMIDKGMNPKMGATRGPEPFKN